ncbi:hypothetical protein RHMOL_Rhmol13G0281000 [Rhododendron molle]|uniref:Uncharacterized protein n=1 Tax=Rhododendron molle TaxID=49168 RepID=A0ACC0LBI4_RHOML|nr:hypothetical protein RHMOL_Rhmol13G0281000 [Rhododendron molle]
MSLLRQEFVGFDAEDVGLDWVSLAFEDNMVCWYVPKLVLSGFLKKKVTLMVFRGDGVVNRSGGGGEWEAVIFWL